MHISEDIARGCLAILGDFKKSIKSGIHPDGNGVVRFQTLTPSCMDKVEGTDSFYESVDFLVEMFSRRGFFCSTRSGERNGEEFIFFDLRLSPRKEVLNAIYCWKHSGMIDVSPMAHGRIVEKVSSSVNSATRKLNYFFSKNYSSPEVVGQTKPTPQPLGFKLLR